MSDLVTGDYVPRVGDFLELCFLPNGRTMERVIVLQCDGEATNGYGDKVWKLECLMFSHKDNFKLPTKKKISLQQKDYDNLTLVARVSE